MCSGNICRSPLAHAVFQNLLQQNGGDERYFIESSGTTAYHVGDNADSRMRQTAARHGIRVDHRARQFTREDLTNYDLILVMDRDNYRTVRSLAEGVLLAEKIHMFREFDPECRHNGVPCEVPDPYYGGVEAFEHVYSIVHRTSRNLLEVLERTQQ